MPKPTKIQIAIRDGYAREIFRTLLTKVKYDQEIWPDLKDYYRFLATESFKAAGHILDVRQEVLIKEGNATKPKEKVQKGEG